MGYQPYRAYKVLLALHFQKGKLVSSAGIGYMAADRREETNNSSGNPFFRKAGDTVAKRRLPGIDLLRCLAFFLACGIHFFMFNGFYNEPQQGTTMLLYNSFRWLCFGCIGLFIMLTGFLRCENTDIRACYRSLIPVLLAYLLATAISVPVRHYLLGEPHSAVEWVKLFLQTAFNCQPSTVS